MDKQEKNYMECCRCRYYKPYFLCDYTQYTKLDYGLCVYKDERKPVQKHDTCKEFTYKLYDRVDSKWTLAKLSAAADSINIIMQILKEKSGEE